MQTGLIILHVIVCTILILVVLLQSGKGSDIGAAFGGSSKTIFGATGAATILTKLTTGAAVIFMLTSIGLAIFSSSGHKVESILEDEKNVSIPAEKKDGNKAQEAQKPTQPEAANPATEGKPVQTATQDAQQQPANNPQPATDQPTPAATN